MRVFTGRGLGDLYYDLVSIIKDSGRNVTIRGLKLKEYPEPVTLVYKEPGACWMNIPGRKFNPFFAIAEVPWILSGNGNIEWITNFNKNMRQFADPGEEDFHGAYGLRMRKWPNVFHHDHPQYIDQIEQAVKKLVADPFCRQAVICLWDPIRDNLDKSKDYPCNNLVYLSVRDWKLDMTVVIRSNDLVWGTPHNAVQFTHLLAYITGLLNTSVAEGWKDHFDQVHQVQMGTLTYVVQNLHYYTEQYPETLEAIFEAMETHKRGPGALKHPWFTDVSPQSFEEMMLYVNRVREDRDYNADMVPRQYWAGIIPKMLWLFQEVKRNQTPDEIDALAGHVLTIGEPFTTLIKDFWKESKNPVAKEVVWATHRATPYSSLKDSES